MNLHKPLKQLLWVWVLYLCLVLGTRIVQGNESTASEQIVNLPSDQWPLVVVKFSGPSFITQGNGFAVGDGSLVITAAHVLLQQSANGFVCVPGWIFVVSAAKGDVCTAKVLACNITNDIALLEIPWTNHPAYELCTNDELMDLQQACLLARPRNSDDQPPLPNARSCPIQIEYLKIAWRIPYGMVFSSQANPGIGWSGGVVLTDRKKAAACYNRHLVSTLANERTAKMIGEKAGSGFAATSAMVQELARQAGAANRLALKPRPFTRPTDADQAFQMLLTFKAGSGMTNASSLETARDLNNIRPNSPVIQSLIALCASAHGNTTMAEQAFCKSIQLAPDSALSRNIYALYLMSQRNTTKALDELKTANKADPDNPTTLCNLASAMAEMKLFSDIIALLEPQRQRDNNQPMPLGMLADAYLECGKYSQAIALYRQAIQLFPEWIPPHCQLSRALMLNKQPEEAEQSIRTLLVDLPDNRMTYYLVAQFLIDHKPEKRTDTIELLRKALTMPAVGSLSDSKLQAMLQMLKTTDDAE